MRLFIAEKPSVAKAIADGLGVKSRDNGFIRAGIDTIITWCFGHMLELAEPDEYTPDDVPTNKSGKKIWRTDELPIIPESWILRPKDESKKQFNIIGNLLKDASEVVNAGDPDREGQLLIDEVLEYHRNKLPVRRFWVSAQDMVSISRGLSSLKENHFYHGWAEAARGRQRADWLIGMNLSRAYTLRAQRGGSRVLLTVGRVQTPTLSLVVDRDRAIESFKSVPYFTVQAFLEHDNGEYSATWKAKEDQVGLDPEGRLIDSKIADQLLQTIIGKDGYIKEYKQQPKKQNHPLAFALSDITLLASNKFGYTAEEVLNACQSLYETHKLTSYPRTDCAYLPESQYADAASTLQAVLHVNPELAKIIEGADISIKSKTWNDSKITAHHGIIPTMHNGTKDALNDKERNIYYLIVLSYIAQFYPLHEYLSTSVLAHISNETFAASGKVVTINGWRDVFDHKDEDEKEKDESANQKLPSMAKGDVVTCKNATRKDAKTKPPARFREGTLIRAMENVHKFITDPNHKKILREGDGIGTSATRASIISELKRRMFLEVKGKYLVSTQLGRNLVAALPEVVKNPVLTAIYERMLKAIELGNAELPTFISKQEEFIRDLVSKANAGSVKIAGGGGDNATVISTLYKCMACGHGLIRRPSKKQKRSFWWGCSNYPDCKQTYSDVKGKPDYAVARKN